MDEMLERLPSLPPGVQSKVYGLLNIEVGRLIWIETAAPLDHVSLRFHFFGEQTAGVVLRPSEPVRAYLKNVAQYTIRCNQQTFTKYLNDMTKLVAEVIDDSVNKVLGRVTVNMKLYLRRDESRGRSNLASDFGFSLLEVQGAFPIIAAQKNVKLGEVELVMKTDYTSWKGQGGVRKSLLSSFMLNEIRAEYDDSLPIQPVNSDLRIPNSLYKPALDEDYRPPEEPAVRFQEQAEVVKVPKSALKRIEKPGNNPSALFALQTPESAELPPKDQPVATPQSVPEENLLEKLKERGERLRKKMADSAKVPELVEDFSSLREIDPTLPNLQVLDELESAEESTGHFVMEPVPEAPEVVSTPQPFLDLPSIRYLKINITTLMVLDAGAVKDKTLCLECTVPTPMIPRATTMKKAAENLYASPTSIQTDVLKLSHRGGYDNIYDFKHESIHNVSIGEGVIGTLANQPIRFKLIVGDSKGKETEIARADLMWEKLLMAPGFAYLVVLELMPSALLDAKKQKARGPPTRMKEIGRLTARFELMPEVTQEAGTFGKVVAFNKTATTAQPPVISVPDPIGKAEVSEGPKVQIPAVSPPSRTLQMYLFIESASQLEPRSDSSPRSPFVRYKTFLDNETITTPVLWDWKESSRFNHVLMTPIVSSETVIARLNSGRLNIEVWDKHSASQDELLGLVALSLGSFGSAIQSGAVGLVSSVYPLIAVDEFRAIYNMIRHKDVGYLRICLALGSPAQVQRLQDSQLAGNSKASKPDTPEPVQKTMEQVGVGTSTADMEMARDPSPDRLQMRLTDSVESIGEIAAFLNKKEQPEFTRAPESPHLPPILETRSPPAKPDPEPVKIESPRIDVEGDLIPSLFRKFQEEGIDLDAELRQLDVFNHGFLHSESFARLVEELRLGLGKKEISALIEYIISASDQSSVRKLFHSDILSVLKMTPVRTQNIRHRFEVTLSELTGCKILKMLPEKSVYLRLQFPIDEGVSESCLLAKEERQSLVMKSVHTCTVSEGQQLEDCIPSTAPGLMIWLCKNEERCETRVLGKAILPSEELIDLSSEGGKLSRVLCLYADQNKAINSLNSDVIGKIRCQVKYAQERTSDVPGVSQSSELLMERRTSVEMNIPKHSLLTVFVSAATNLDRALSYYQNQRVLMDRDLMVFTRIRLFHESKQLQESMEEISTKTVSGLSSAKFSQRFQLEVTITEAVLNYIQTKSALIEVVTLLQDEELVLGSAQISLLPVLLSSIKGEFPLLNLYGQYMGSIFLALSLNKDDIRADFDDSEKAAAVSEKTVPDVIPQEAKEPTSPEVLRETVEQLPTKPSPFREDRTPCAKLLITIESGIRISPASDGGRPNPYVKLIWKEVEVHKTPPILRSTCPAWSSTCALPLYPEDLETLKTQPLIFVLFHKPLEDAGEEEFLGRVTVDLSQLVRPGINAEITGWYHIMVRDQAAGQLKVHVSPSINLYEVLIRPADPMKSWSTLSFSHTDPQPRTSVFQSQIDMKMQSISESLAKTRDQDLLALHTQKMKDLDQLTEYFDRKARAEEGEARTEARAQRYLSDQEENEPVDEIHPDLSSENERIWSERQVLDAGLLRREYELEAVPETRNPADSDLHPEMYEPNFEPEEILKSIREAAEFMPQDPEPRSPQRVSPPPVQDAASLPSLTQSAEEFPAAEDSDNIARKSSESADTKRDPPTQVNTYPKPSPIRERKPPISKLKVGSEELSRIEAIMRGSGHSAKSNPRT